MEVIAAPNAYFFCGSLDQIEGKTFLANFTAKLFLTVMD
jgi:hypothetical protein